MQREGRVRPKTLPLLGEDEHASRSVNLARRCAVRAGRARVARGERGAHHAGEGEEGLEEAHDEVSGTMDGERGGEGGGVELEGQEENTGNAKNTTVESESTEADYISDHYRLKPEARTSERMGLSESISEVHYCLCTIVKAAARL